MSMIQTESPYFQGSANTQAPLPFDQVSGWPADPSWDDCGSATTTCNVAWALIVESSSNIYINGAGLYSWFQNYDETCVNTQDCQQKMIYIYNSANFWLSNVVTIGAVEMITPAQGNTVNEIVIATNNTQGNQYPWWSVVATYEDSTANINTTTAPVVIKTGWVAFGDSYAAGIGAGSKSKATYAELFKL
jgi:glucan 1,3-beta-glucosidase